VARALEAIYASGVRPDWWKLPPSADPGAWQAIDSAIERNDPRCRGVLVLGMEAGDEALEAGFGQAARSRRVRGFAVGRSIFGAAAKAWFAGRMGEAEVVDEVGRRYEEVIGLWKTAQRSQPKLRESA
jgi:5-dehydro-2-deoxygluconokinase